MNVLKRTLTKEQAALVEAVVCVNDLAFCLGVICGAARAQGVSLEVFQSAVNFAYEQKLPAIVKGGDA